MTESPTLHVVTLGLGPRVLAHLDRELGSQFSVTATDSPVEAMAALLETPTKTAVLSEVDLCAFGGDRRGLAFLRVALFRAPHCSRILLTTRSVVLDDDSARAVDAIFSVPWPEGTLSRYLATRSRPDEDSANV